MTATVIPFSRFLEEREKKVDPKGYAAKKIHAAIDRQVRQVKANDPARPLLVRDTPLIETEWDEEAGCEVVTYRLGDPGDET